MTTSQTPPLSLTSSPPNRVAEVRRNLGITQARLSSLTGIAQPDISKLETGRGYAGPTTRQRVSAALGAPEHILFPRESAHSENDSEVSLPQLRRAS